MFDIARELGLNRPFRTQDQASAMIGAQITYDGEAFTCDGFNDLGALYWRSHNDGKQYCGRNLDIAAIL